MEMLNRLSQIGQMYKKKGSPSIMRINILLSVHTNNFLLLKLYTSGNFNITRASISILSSSAFIDSVKYNGSSPENVQCLFLIVAVAVSFHFLSKIVTPVRRNQSFKVIEQGLSTSYEIHLLLVFQINTCLFF